MSGSIYVKLPVELQHPMKGLINIQNNDNKYFMWCHVRNLNSLKHSERISKKDKEICKNLDSNGIDFPVSKKDYGKIEDLNKINFNVFGYENKVVFPVYLSNRKFNDYLDLLLIFDHYMYIKDFNRLMFNRNKNKKYFCKSCLQCFSSENVLNNHKEYCSLVNGKQNVKLEKGFISFKNYSRQIPVPFKIYVSVFRF